MEINSPAAIKWASELGRKYNYDWLKIIREQDRVDREKAAKQTSEGSK
jgi:hypothetical protein